MEFFNFEVEFSTVWLRAMNGLIAGTFPVSDNSKQMKETKMNAKRGRDNSNRFYPTGEFYVNRGLLLLAGVRQMAICLRQAEGLPT